MSTAGQKLGIGIIRACSGDAAILTSIALSAKRHWGYPDSWIDDWREFLTITPEFVTTYQTYAALLDDRIMAFYALCPREHLL